MKKPDKKPQLIREDCSLLECYVGYSSADFRNFADEMDEQGIMEIEIEGGIYEGSPEFYQSRMESPDQAKVRYTRELKKWETWKKKEAERKEKQKQKLIRDAKKLGMVLSDE